MKIVLSDEMPVVSGPRRTSYNDRQVIDKLVREWLDEVIVKQSFSEYSSPVVLVSKKKRDNFPTAVGDDVVQRLQGKVYTTIDLKNCYFHVPIEEESRKYPAFVTNRGQYEFQFVPFGLCNCPAVFCGYISVVFHDLISDGTVVNYITEIEGVEKLRRVLSVAWSNGLKIKWENCQSLQRKI